MFIMLKKSLLLASVATIVLGIPALTIGLANAQLQKQPAGSKLDTTPDAKLDSSRILATDRAAVVNANGTFARGFGVVGTSRLGLGTYQVIFNRNVRLCVYNATIGLAGAAGSSPPGEITVVGRATSVNGVFITTHNSAGAPADRGFHLHVVC
jgi:hypothetical protein